MLKVDNSEDKKILTASQAQLLSLKSAAEVNFVHHFEDEEDFTFDHWPEIIGYSRRLGRFLNWRYFEIPRHNYKALRSPNGQFAVYRIETIKDHTETVLRILEWNLAGPSAVSAMKMIVDDAREHNAILMDFFCTAEIVGLELEKLGFLPEKQLLTQIPYLFRPIKWEAPGISAAIDLPPHRTKRHIDFLQWYITKGDTDMDRIKL
jgi:hypothetical protein